MDRETRDKRGVPNTLQELLAYMRTLRRKGYENYLLGRLAPGHTAEELVEFLLEKGYRAPLNEKVDTIVISDIHLGSKHSLAEALQKALAQFSFKRLVLNGDIFDHLEFTFEELEPSQQKFLRYVDTLSQTHEVVWIRGNHDNELSDFLGGRVQVPVYKEYEWEYEGKRYLALHGDQFDRFYHEHPLMYNAGTHFYQFLQWLGPSTRRFCALLKRKTKLYTRAITLSIEGALRYAQMRNIDYVICGHTHHVYQQARGSVRYYNPGGWTENVGHLIAIGAQGVRVHAFSAQGEHLGIAVTS